MTRQLAAVSGLAIDLAGAPPDADLRSAWPSLKVLLTSGYSEGIVDQGAAAPGSPFIAKPYSALALAAKVREVLDGEE